MKIAYITAGAGGMYCGGCLRDNTLAAALLAASHQVLLIPLYTPTRTDENNLSEKRIFLGGINVYLQQHFSFFRRSPWLLDRVLDFPPLLKLASRWGIRVDPGHLGSMTVSVLKGADGRQSKEVNKLVRFLKQEAAPEIINLPNSMLLGLAPALKSELRVPVCCTLQGEDLFLEGLAEPHRSEALELIRSHAGHVDGFIAVSESCASHMARYLGIDRKRIHVVSLGINLEGYGLPVALAPQPFTIGYLARIAPEKGLHQLCEAYRRLRQDKGLPPSRIRVAGYLAPEYRPYFRQIRKNVASWDLSAEFRYHGELNRRQKIAFLQELHVLSVPGPYDEPKGIFLLEAMANGVPVVQPRRGAFTEIIEKTGGGILVKPEDPEALADGILSLWKNPQRRVELGRHGYEGVREHFSASRMAESAVAVYRALGAGS